MMFESPTEAIRGDRVYRRMTGKRYPNHEYSYWRVYDRETGNPLHHGSFDTLDEAIRQLEGPKCR